MENASKSSPNQRLICSLLGSQSTIKPESSEHLFLECAASKILWKKCQMAPRPVCFLIQGPGYVDQGHPLPVAKSQNTL